MNREKTILLPISFLWFTLVSSTRSDNGGGDVRVRVFTIFIRWFHWWSRACPEIVQQAREIACAARMCDLQPVTICVRLGRTNSSTDEKKERERKPKVFKILCFHYDDGKKKLVKRTRPTTNNTTVAHCSRVGMTGFHSAPTCGPS